jgi:homoserine kinase type II
LPVKTTFSKTELTNILSNYDLGKYKASAPFTGGTVQTNYFLQTTGGKFVFRYYEGRSKESVLFESNLISYLKVRNYPCPALIKDKQGKSGGIYNQKPYVIFEFIEGEHIEYPTENQKEQLIEKVAELHNITKNYRPRNKKYRWNYSIGLCSELAGKTAEKINSENAQEKLKWLEQELTELKLPESLPKGVCHCDFHFSNVLFKAGKFKALIDFDDANYTFLMFDLVGLIESEAWRYAVDEVINFKEARKVISKYTKYRPLNNTEKRHLFDLYKLSILFDCVWYFERGQAKDFYEKRKIDYLNSVGRENFYRQLFA